MEIGDRVIFYNWLFGSFLGKVMKIYKRYGTAKISTDKYIEDVVNNYTSNKMLVRIKDLKVVKTGLFDGL